MQMNPVIDLFHLFKVEEIEGGGKGEEGAKECSIEQGES